MSDHRTSFPHHVDVAKHMALCRGRPIWYLLCRSDAFQSFVQNLWLDSLFPVVRVPVGTSTTETTIADGDGGGVRSRGGGGVPRNLSVPAVATPLDDENETMTMYVAGEPCVPSSMMTMMMASHDGRTIAPSSSFRPSSPSSRRGGSSVNYAQDPRDISTQREITSSAGGVLAASTMIASTTGNSSSIFPLSSSAAASASPHDIPTSAAFPKMMNGKRETILKGFRALVESHERRSANTTRMMAGGSGSGGGGGGGFIASSVATTASQFPARVGATQPFVQDPNYHQSHGGGRNGASLSTAATLFRPSSAGGRGVGVLSGSAVAGGAGKNYPMPLNAPPPPRIPSANILRNEIYLARQQQQQQPQPQPQPQSLETETGDASSPTKSVVSDDDNIQRQARPNDWMLETPVLARYRLWIATSRARSQVDRITEILSAIASAMCHQGPVDTMQSLLETVVQHPVEKYRLASEQEQNASLVRKGATAATASAGQVSSSTHETGNTVNIANGDPATTNNENDRAPEQIKDVDHDTENKGEDGGDDEGEEGDDGDGGEWYQRTHEAFYLSSQVALLELRVFGYLPAPSPLSKTAGHHASGQRHQRGGKASHHHLEDHSLLSNPSDLLRTRLDMRKRAPLDPAIQIELLLRRADIKQALALWWHWLPKHSLRRDGGSNGNERKGSDRDSEAISRNVFVQIAIHVHCALAGGSLPLASPSTLEALRRLCYEDWPYLFMSYQQLQRVKHDELHTPSKSVGGSGHGHNGHGGGVSVSVSSQFRALLAKGVECPLSFNRSLFDVAMLLLLEPWMETSVPEERLLALSMLFQKTFERKKMRRAADHNKHEYVIGAAATSDTDDETDPRGCHARSFSSLYYYRLRALPILPNNADGVVLSRPASSAATRPYHLLSGGGGGSTTNSPSRGGVRPSSPGAAAFSQKVAPVRELVEQLDAAADKNLGLKQALRNKAELSDVSVELTKDAWRSEVLRLNLRKARSRGTTFILPTEVSSTSTAADGTIHDTVPFTELELKKTFAPHDASRSFGLERVLLQRLTKRVADCSAAALVLHRQQDFDSKFAKSAGHDSNEVLQMLPNTSATLHRPGSPFRPAGGGGPQQNITTTDEATLKAAVRATQQANIVVHATKHLIPPEYLHQIARYHRSAVEAFRDQVKTATIALCQGGGGSGAAAAAGARADDDHDGTMFDGDDALLLDVNTLADMLAPPPRRGFEKPLIAASMTPEEAMEEKMARSSACFVRRPASAQGYTQHTNHDDGAGQDEGDGAGILNGVSESLRRPLSALLGRTAPHGLRDTRPRHLATHPKPTSRPLSAAQIKQQQQQQPTTIYISPYMKVGALPVTGGSAFASKKHHQHHRPSSAAR
ncbi:Hypothetical protein, putative [Bodo saltans]|uniref:Uncharacterized protein n=1 Tax=Bodo saltans TaxID=75058 RepID=A0A0S4J519_BODSA|nr:Hypothetical protein, putative [Bodo saltans]|eukprot:CUG79962.1 Hypothetical protein, putative [Bodo saltans]